MNRSKLCPERELLEAELMWAIKRWTELENIAGDAIQRADLDANQYLGKAHQQGMRR